MKLTKSYLKQLISEEIQNLSENIAADRQVRFRNKKEDPRYRGMSDSDINLILSAEDEVKDLTNKGTGKISPESATSLKARYARILQFINIPT